MLSALSSSAIDPGVREHTGAGLQLVHLHWLTLTGLVGERKVLADSAGIMVRVDEIILRDVVIQFDGRVVEVFGSSSGGLRHHVALLKEPQVHAPDRKGRTQVTVAGTMFGADADELPRLMPFLEKIREAMRIASGQPPA